MCAESLRGGNVVADTGAMQGTPPVLGQDHGRCEYNIIRSRCAGGELDVLAGGHQVGGQSEVCDQMVSVVVPQTLAEHVQAAADKHFLVVFADIYVRVREAAENCL